MCGTLPETFPIRWPSHAGLVGATSRQTRASKMPLRRLTPDQVPRLKLKWAFGFPGDVNLNSQPSIAGGRVYVGSQGAKVYSLSAATGCIHWWFSTAAPVRSAVAWPYRDRIGAAVRCIFGDSSALYAVDASTGHCFENKGRRSLSRAITGSPAFHHGRLYVPVASIEEGSATMANYECCRFRGSAVALDGRRENSYGRRIRRRSSAADKEK